MDVPQEPTLTEFINACGPVGIRRPRNNDEAIRYLMRGPLGLEMIRDKLQELGSHGDPKFKRRLFNTRDQLVQVMGVSTRMLTEWMRETSGTVNAVSPAVHNNNNNTPDPSLQLKHHSAMPTPTSTSSGWTTPKSTSKSVSSDESQTMEAQGANPFNVLDPDTRIGSNEGTTITASVDANVGRRRKKNKHRSPPTPKCPESHDGAPTPMDNMAPSDDPALMSPTSHAVPECSVDHEHTACHAPPSEWVPLESVFSFLHALIIDVALAHRSHPTLYGNYTLWKPDLSLPNIGMRHSCG